MDFVSLNYLDLSCGISCSNLGPSLDAFTEMLHFFPQSLQVNALIEPPRPSTSELFPVIRY